MSTNVLKWWNLSFLEIRSSSSIDREQNYSSRPLYSYHFWLALFARDIQLQVGLPTSLMRYAFEIEKESIGSLLPLLLFRCIKLANFQSASISIVAGLLCMPNFKIWLSKKLSYSRQRHQSPFFKSMLPFLATGNLALVQKGLKLYFKH